MIRVEDVTEQVKKQAGEYFQDGVIVEVTHERGDIVITARLYDYIAVVAFNVATWQQENTIIDALGTIRDTFVQSLIVKNAPTQQSRF